MAIIIGIDPGSHITGYGIIRSIGLQLIYIDSGYIRITGSKFSSKLKLIYTNIIDIISKFNPEYFAIEQIFMAKNPNSALKLGQVLGVAIVAAANKEIPVFEYATRQVKQTVVGIGNADKHQVQHMVKILLKLNSNPQTDAADALAVAITHSRLSETVTRLNQGKLKLRNARLSKHIKEIM